MGRSAGVPMAPRHKDRLVEKISDVIQTKEVVMARVVQALGNISFSLRRAESWSVVQALPTNTCVCIYIHRYIHIRHAYIYRLSVRLSVDRSIYLPPVAYQESEKEPSAVFLVKRMSMASILSIVSLWLRTRKPAYPQRLKPVFSTIHIKVAYPALPLKQVT